MHHSALLNVMIAAARKTARALEARLRRGRKPPGVYKGPANFVSAADKHAEERCYAELAKARPNHGFLGEEGGCAAKARDKSHRWIVDPLDGTSNFLHGIPRLPSRWPSSAKSVIVAGLVSTIRPAGALPRGEGQRRLPQRPPHPGRRTQTIVRLRLIACGIHSAAATSICPACQIGAIQVNVAGLRRYGATRARPRLCRRQPLRRLLGHRKLSPWVGDGHHSPVAASADA